MQKVAKMTTIAQRTRYNIFSPQFLVTLRMRKIINNTAPPPPSHIQYGGVSAPPKEGGGGDEAKEREQQWRPRAVCVIVCIDCSFSHRPVGESMMMEAVPI
jgi:hypothetical protein